MKMELFARGELFALAKCWSRMAAEECKRVSDEVRRRSAAVVGRRDPPQRCVGLCRNDLTPLRSGRRGERPGVQRAVGGAITAGEQADPVAEEGKWGRRRLRFGK